MEREGAVHSGDPLLDEALERWLRWDKNARTRREVLEAVARAEWDSLRASMLSRIKFGTAGLRGKMGAGFKCMNDVIVLQTAQGLCAYFQNHCTDARLKNGIVVGFDGRYNSKRFAELTARVFAAAAVPVRLFSDICPTPFVSFATVRFGCAGGVMVTASHNPKQDNGYKVYWGNGSQIISPHDDNILKTIMQNLDIPEKHWEIEDVRSHALVSDPLEEVSASYCEYIRDGLSARVLRQNKDTGVKIVYSAMHGVGYEAVSRAFGTANLAEPECVLEQRDPDPEFPTVVFPNPEEPECLVLSRELAETVGARLLLVNDPDADRLAVAEYDLSTKELKVFSGNEMGALLGWWLLKQHKESAGDASARDVYFVASVVSSKMLRSVARAEGCRFVETLTGFKWMGNKTLLLLEQGKLPLFAFEEAIGYMCSARVPDKDGVSAAVQVASLASELYACGSSLSEQLQQLYVQYGYHASHNSYYVCHDPLIIKKIFKRIRNYHGPNTYPKKVGSCDIVEVHDLAMGVKIPKDNEIPLEGASDTFERPSLEGTGLELEYTGGEMVMFTCSNTLLVTVRTSGTEPKIKYYTELVASAPNALEQERVKQKLIVMVNEFIEDLLQPGINGLVA